MECEKSHGDGLGFYIMRKFCFIVLILLSLTTKIFSQNKLIKPVFEISINETNQHYLNIDSSFTLKSISFNIQQDTFTIINTFLIKDSIYFNNKFEKSDKSYLKINDTLIDLHQFKCLGTNCEFGKLEFICFKKVPLNQKETIYILSGLDLGNTGFWSNYISTFLIYQNNKRIEIVYCEQFQKETDLYKSKNQIYFNFYEGFKNKLGKIKLKSNKYFFNPTLKTFNPSI